MWEVEYTDEFGQWWDGLTQAQQEALDDRVMLLLYDTYLEELAEEGLLDEPGSN